MLGSVLDALSLHHLEQLRHLLLDEEVGLEVQVRSTFGKLFRVSLLHQDERREQHAFQ